MSSSNHPVILIVPGAFGTPAGFDKLAPHLDGLQTHPGAYPSCNHPDPLNATCAADITAVRSIILSLLDQQRDVVILAHSYGGVVAGGAAKDLDRETRKAQDHSSAVVGLVYIAGNITLEGETLFEAVGGAYPPFIKEHTPSEGFALIRPAMDVLYNDCDPALQPAFDASVQPHALKAFETKPPAPAWADKGFDGRRLYVRTLDDHCNPSFLQDAWIQKSKVDWEVVDFKTGHMPFVSQPEALGAQIVRFVWRLGQF
ncbi:Alpha/Beta hydrolase protein [Xylaria intraflava]|nr:Alpha/Beta hydrolase protein [Xylaria intraflava]